MRGCDSASLSTIRKGHTIVLNRRNVLWNIVILGLDPKIHKDKSIMLVSLWIAGSKSGNDKDEKSGIDLPLFSYCHEEVRASDNLISNTLSKKENK